MIRNKKLGLFFIISPWVILAVLVFLIVLLQYTQLSGGSFVSPTPLPQSEEYGGVVSYGTRSIAQIIDSILKFFVTLDLAYSLIGLIAGIRFLKRRETSTSKPAEDELKAKNKKIGLLLLLSPWVILLTVSVLFILYIKFEDYLEIRYHAFPILPRFIGDGLWFLGVLDILYLLVGTGLGIYFLTKKKKLRI